MATSQLLAHGAGACPWRAVFGSGYLMSGCLCGVGSYCSSSISGVVRVRGNEVVLVMLVVPAYYAAAASSAGSAAASSIAPNSYETRATAMRVLYGRKCVGEGSV